MLVQQQSKNTLGTRGKKKCFLFNITVHKPTVVSGWSTIPGNLEQINFTTINVFGVEKEK